MPGTMSVGGVISGLDTNEIIAKVMEAAKRPQLKLEADKATAQARLAAWQDLNTRVLALKLKCDSISSASSFISKQVTSSDQNVIWATATAQAATGTYFVKVTSRAQSHQLSSQAYTSTETATGTGTVSVSFANGESFSVDIDASNNTLAGLRDAINRADGGAHAVIINSGTQENPSYRLLVTSDKSGTDYAMTVDTSGLAGGTAPVVDQEVQAASDATIVLGEGVGQITVTKSTNTFSDLIPGVTLNVAGADASKTIKIEVTRNTAAVKTAIQDFVTQYNDLADAIGKQFDYDSDSGETGLLFGSNQLQLVQADIARAIGNTVEGINIKFNALAAVGITLDTSGYLRINDSELSKALVDNPEDVARLFGSDLTSDSSSIGLISTNPDTKPSGVDGWDVVITQAARRAQVTAAVAMSNPLDADETLVINSQLIDLTAGMTLSQVIEEINKHSSQTGVSALATGADGTGSGSYLTLRTIRYGSKVDVTACSNVSNSAGNTSGLGNVQVSGADPGGETGTGVGLTGLDVEGTINGEACTGSGQILTADPADEDSPIKGLVLRITSSGPLTSSVYFSKGVGARLRDLLVNMTSNSGIITQAEKSLNSEIDELSDTIEDWNSRLEAQEARLYDQFNRMETQLARLQQQGSYLAAQLSSLNNSSKK